MIRNLCFSTVALVLALLVSCNKDDVITDGGPKPVITLDNPDGIYPVKVGKSVTIAPTVENAEGADYAWILDGEPAGSAATFTFTAEKAGYYYLVFRVETANGSAEEELRIDVNLLQPPVISFPVGEDKTMEVETGRETIIAPTVANGDGATYTWTLGEDKVGTEPTYTFNPDKLDSYRLTLHVENEDGEDEETITVRVVDRFPVTAVFPAPSYLFGTAGVRTVSKDRTLCLRPYLEHFHNPTFAWMVDGQPAEGKGEFFTFKPDGEGEYTVVVTVTDDDGATASASVTVTCCSDEASHKRTGGTNRFSNEVYEYTPAPGQFINEGGSIASAEAAAAYAQEQIRKNAEEGKDYYVSLGAWGGSIVVGFDHSIENKGGYNGYDFSITGNQFAQSSEPGIVWVMQDTNGNGLPDDEWYELKGSEYGKPETLQFYAMTYYRPKSDNTAIQWKDNRGNAGQVERNNSHKQGYFPQWITDESYTLYGTRLAANTTQDPITGDYRNNPYEEGYADNAGRDQAAGEVADGNPRKNYFKIANAVNADGSAADLQYIDFIKVQTGISHNSGPLGEVSTEVFAFEDENI